MSPISSISSLLPTVPATDKGSTEALSAAINLSDGQSLPKGSPNFRQVFQMLNMNQEGVSQGDISYKSLQLHLPESPQFSEQFDSGDIDLGRAGTLADALSLIQKPLEEHINGQGLSTIQVSPGEALPPGLGMPESGQPTTGLIYDGIPAYEGIPNPLMSQLNAVMPKLQEVEANFKSEPGLESDVNETMLQARQKIPPVTVQTISLENQSQTPINAEVVLPKNTSVLTSPLLDKNSLATSSDLSLNRGHSESFNQASLQSQTTENPIKQVISNSTSLTNTQGAEQGLKSTVDSRQGAIAEAKGELSTRVNTHLNHLSRDSGAAELSDTVDADRYDRAGNTLTEVRARIQGTGLRQYATGVEAHVNDPDWGDQISQKVVWLSGRNIQSAKLQLNPAELGPVEVKISVQNDQTTITFNAQHASVREMLETNLHRLREMMNENGVDLADVDVASGDQESPHTAQQNSDSDESSTQNSGTQSHSENVANVHDLEHEQSAATVSAINLVDYYA